MVIDKILSGEKMKRVCNFEIIDIIELKRDKTFMKTVNKSCDVLSCRIDGKGSFFCKGEQPIEVNGGDVLFIPSGSSYSQSTDREHIICFHLIKDSEFFDKITLLKSNDTKKYSEIFQKAYALWNTQSEKNIYKCKSLLYEIVADFEPEHSDKYPTASILLKEGLDYLDEYTYSTDFSVEQACARSHISRTYFNRIFKRTFGCTPINYVMTARIRKAENLVLTGIYSTEEVAYLCGFSSIKYFYTVFKKITGYTVKEYIRHNSHKHI